MRRTLSIGMVVIMVAACGAGGSLPLEAGSSPTASSVLPSRPTDQPASSAPTSPGVSPSPIPDEPLAGLPDGSIVFMRQGSNGRFQTWTACLDLTKSIQLTKSREHETGWAVWSPDGTRIAFNANYEDPNLEDELDIWDIYTMDAQGGEVVRVTESDGLFGDPGYSRDGALIAFDSTVPGNEGIFVMDAADGRSLRRVIALPEGVITAYAPRFSPDGTEIVFTGESSDRAGALFVVGIDGSGLRRITPATLFPTKAAWSPDGRTIAFDAASDRFPHQSLWLVRPDGTGLVDLMLDFQPNPKVHGFSAPAWSPDGSQLVTLHGLHPSVGKQTTRLATLRPDGTELRYVTDGKHGEAFKPDWRAQPC